MNINDNTGVITSAGGKYMLDLMEIRIGLDGLVFSHDETMMDFEFDFNTGTTRGVKLIASAAGVIFQARNAGVLTDVPINYWFLQNGEWAKPRNVEFIARPDRWCVLRENGKVVAAHQFTPAQMALGQISPKPAIFNRASGTARYLRVGQVSLTLCH